jgi:hypothetical protein
MSSQQTLPRPAEGIDAFRAGRWASPRPFRPYGRFFFWFFLIPAVLYLTAIPLVRTPRYYRWAPSHYGPVLDFAFNTQHENADIVLFGDSSAFLGIDPRLVDRELRLKSLVLPNTAGSLPVLDDRALEFYLAHNTRPRLIVLYFTAWDLDFAHTRESHLYEGEEMLLRHGSASQIAGFTLKHPLELAAFPFRSYSSLGPGVLKSLLRGVDREGQAAQALGHADDTEDYLPLARNCVIPSRDVSQRQTETVRALAAKYIAQGYRVAVYLAPIPACGNASAFAGLTYNGLAVAPPAVLPASGFLADGLYAHIEPASVPAASHLFAQTIQPHTQSSSQSSSQSAKRLDAPSS